MLLALLMMMSSAIPPDIAREVTIYDAAQRDARLGRHTIEQAFEAATRFGEFLVADSGPLSRLESMTAAEYDLLAQSAPGMLINREEIVFATPDPAYFLAIAKKYGTAADVDFFTSYSATFPQGVWASYIQQQTDVSGCTDFGSHELVARYADWLAFRAKHPHAYAAEVAKQLEKIEEEIASSCACGDQRSVVRELENFVKRFPGSTAALKARHRLDDIRKPASGMRYHCVPG
jgi:hypothetical protein